MNHIPIYISVGFILITLLTVFFFYKASRNNRTLLFVVFAWMGIQAAVAATGFFTVTDTIPPRFVLLLALPMAAIAFTLFTRKGRSFVEGFDLQQLSLLHAIRIGVEIVLFLLFLNKALPQLMTFEGRNFDLVAGVTAPMVYYLGFIKRRISGTGILAWNVICLGILLFTVGNAILSAEILKRLKLSNGRNIYDSPC